jgi:hypothetical protein
MIKILSFFLTLGFVTSAYAADIILRYRCSDGVYQSRLELTNDGLVTLNESCSDACPKHTYAQQYQISNDELAVLTGAIQEVKSGHISKKTLHQFECSGELTVFSSGLEILVQSVQAPLYSHTADMMRLSSPSTETLVSWISKYVKQKISSDR